MTKFKYFSFVFLIGLFVFGFSGCSLGDALKKADEIKKQEQQEDKNQTNNQEENLENQESIKKFSSETELREFLKNNNLDSDSGEVFYSKNMAMDGLAMTESAMPSDFVGMDSAEQATGMGGRAQDFSQTNIQVQGVDEADILKTDGEYVYALVEKDLYIIKAYPPSEGEVVSKINFKSYPQSFYINNNRLAIFGYDNDIRTFPIYETFIRQGDFSFFKVFDISDKKNPKQVRDLRFEGSYTDSRMIGDYVYFITNTYNYYYLEDEPILPRIIEDGEELTSDCEVVDKCFSSDIYYFGIPYHNYNFVNVASVNLADKDEKIKTEIYLMSGGQNIYVSKENLYITYTKYLNEYEFVSQIRRDEIFPLLSSEEREKITKIEQAENFILSENEKINKINIILEKYLMSLQTQERNNLEEKIDEAVKENYSRIIDELEKTVIHKVAIKNGDLEYVAGGSVKGYTLNQFSMDEKDGFFRIATTKNQNWSRYAEEQSKSYSNLYVLNEKLEEVGAIEGLAPDERIYSVRFMQDRAYMVTFKQVDPLFVIDLSNPLRPEVLGELKIPGYSDYLHPYDNETLIGLGKDTKTDSNGRVTTGGVKLSLFDVSDVSAPKEIDTYILGGEGSDSLALREHKAFLFSKEKNLLSIPVSLRESSSPYSSRFSFGGVAVFSVDKNGFELKGRVDHSEGGRESDYDYYGYYDNMVKRSLYMDDFLYTFSNNFLLANRISDLEEAGKIEIKKESDSDFEIIN